MIHFKRFELKNGLRVIIHEDHSTPMTAVNVLYNVGSRDELPEKTGFAHLFEHLMFGGSAHIPEFDTPIQMAGGENNAFTNNDFTDFYEVLPSENIEIAFWLESDRMLKLNFDEKVLDVQRKVVVEEFKETCLNEPYGDVWHHISDMAYQIHPYRWPTIGKIPQHVENASMEDVKQFFYKYYRPNNAVLVVAGNVNTRKTINRIEKWFADIPPGESWQRNLPAEPPQTAPRRRQTVGKAPLDAIYMAFHTCGRLEPDFYAVDLLSDVLGSGPSSRLYRRLLKEQQLFSHIDCYITANIDPGLLIIEGKPSQNISIAEAEEAIWKELEDLKRDLMPESELQKQRNKAESALVFSEVSALTKAINLAFFELNGNVSLINKEIKLYDQVTTHDMWRIANEVLSLNNSSTLIYRAAPSNGHPNLASEETEND